MAERIRFISHQNHTVLLIDLSNRNAEQVTKICQLTKISKSFSQRDLPTFKSRQEALECWVGVAVAWPASVG